MKQKINVWYFVVLCALQLDLIANHDTSKLIQNLLMLEENKELEYVNRMTASLLIVDPTYFNQNNKQFFTYNLNTKIQKVNLSKLCLDIKDGTFKTYIQKIKFNDIKNTMGLNCFKNKDELYWLIKERGFISDFLYSPFSFETYKKILDEFIVHVDKDDLPKYIKPIINNLNSVDDKIVKKSFDILEKIYDGNDKKELTQLLCTIKDVKILPLATKDKIATLLLLDVTPFSQSDLGISTLITVIKNLTENIKLHNLNRELYVSMMYKLAQKAYKYKSNILVKEGLFLLNSFCKTSSYCLKDFSDINKLIKSKKYRFQLLNESESDIKFNTQEKLLFLISLLKKEKNVNEFNEYFIKGLLNGLPLEMKFDVDKTFNDELIKFVNKRNEHKKKTNNMFIQNAHYINNSKSLGIKPIINKLTYLLKLTNNINIYSQDEESISNYLYYLYRLESFISKYKFEIGQSLSNKDKTDIQNVISDLIVLNHDHLEYQEFLFNNIKELGLFKYQFIVMLLTNYKDKNKTLNSNILTKILNEQFSNNELSMIKTLLLKVNISPESIFQYCKDSNNKICLYLFEKKITEKNLVLSTAIDNINDKNIQYLKHLKNYEVFYEKTRLKELLKSSTKFSKYSLHDININNDIFWNIDIVKYKNQINRTTLLKKLTNETILNDWQTMKKIYRNYIGYFSVNDLLSIYNNLGFSKQYLDVFLILSQFDKSLQNVLIDLSGIVNKANRNKQDLILDYYYLILNIKSEEKIYIVIKEKLIKYINQNLKGVNFNLILTKDLEIKDFDLYNELKIKKEQKEKSTLIKGSIGSLLFTLLLFILIKGRMFWERKKLKEELKKYIVNKNQIRNISDS